MEIRRDVGGRRWTERFGGNEDVGKVRRLWLQIALI